ncbi:fasciclin-like arabinogalactan protein 14, partial [Manihot esculenta]
LTMSPISSASHFALFFSFFLLFSTASAFNITRILSNYSDFGSFNDMLSRNHLAEDINNRRTITILAVDNVSPLDSLSSAAQKRVLSLHVVLDYYDIAKLKKLSKKSAVLTTLYQSSGQARGRQGFLNVTSKGGDQIVFGSAIAGSSLNSNLVKSVAAQPYNISVLQVSSLIMPDSVVRSKSTQRPAKAPAPASPAPAPSPEDADSPSPTADASASSPIADGPVADSPEADSHGVASASGGSLAMVGMVLFFVWGLPKMI